MLIGQAEAEAPSSWIYLPGSQPDMWILESFFSWCLVHKLKYKAYSAELHMGSTHELFPQKGQFENSAAQWPMNSRCQFQAPGTTLGNIFPEKQVNHLSS